MSNESKFFIGPKMLFFPLSFEDLKNEKQILCTKYLLEKTFRFVFKKFVKTCREFNNNRNFYNFSIVIFEEGAFRYDVRFLDTLQIFPP